MICRMNRRQRDSLIELIQAIVNDQEHGDHLDAVRRLEAEKDFHQCFEDQSEDDLDHVKGS